jgi:beta-galactosidase
MKEDRMITMRLNGNLKCAGRCIAVALGVFMMLFTATSQDIRDEEQRQVFNLNEGWSYLEDNLSRAEELATTQKQWVPITLPHTWNRTDAIDQEPGYRRSASWYKRVLFVPSVTQRLRYVLKFEGVNIKSDVYVNGTRAGGHIGGYVSFGVDITPFLKRGEENVILVRADNSYDPDVIPSQKSDFCIYGGITRDVWLNVVPLRRIENIWIKTPIVSKASAETVLDIVMASNDAAAFKGELEVTIKDRSGKEVARKRSPVSFNAGTTRLSVTMPVVSNPQLWSPANPALYTARVVLTQAGRIVDELSDRVGYRWFEFKEHGPFFLNGERLLLRGTHRHEDFAGFANAMPDSLHRKDMKMIKEMGANFVRLAHYPQDPEVYRACDELGLLVWDELPWCRGGMGGEVWKAHTLRLLEEQILQNYNHPSIIITSLGNEFYWLPDVPGGDNMDSLRMMLRELNALARKLDPSRATATRKFTEGADLVDLVSPSMWPGWYSGVYTMFEKALNDARKNFKRFFHAEYGGDSHVGRHSENPITGDGMAIAEGWEENIKPQKVKNIAQVGDWSESYIVNLFDWYLRISEQTEWLTGNAQWAFKDFPTPLRPENPIPYINQKGLVDRAGKPKDAYHVFKSYWTTSPQFCYIESHTWTDRSGPVGLAREVKVYSNCSEVELVLNGVSQGKRKKDIKLFPAAGLSWKVNFASGSNTLRAVGYANGTVVALDSMTVQYTNRKNAQADRIVLTSQKLPDGNILVIAVAVDESGQRCLDYSKRVYFSSDGGGSLLINEGTPTRSSVVEMANGKAQIEFKPLKGARAVIEARNQDFKGTYVIIHE